MIVPATTENKHELLWSVGWEQINSGQLSWPISGYLHGWLSRHEKTIINVKRFAPIITGHVQKGDSSGVHSNPARQTTKSVLGAFNPRLMIYRRLCCWSIGIWFAVWIKYWSLYLANLFLRLRPAFFLRRLRRNRVCCVTSHCILKDEKNDVYHYCIYTALSRESTEQEYGMTMNKTLMIMLGLSVTTGYEIDNWKRILRRLPISCPIRIDLGGVFTPIDAEALRLI